MLRAPGDGMERRGPGAAICVAWSGDATEVEKSRGHAKGWCARPWLVREALAGARSLGWCVRPWLVREALAGA